MRIITILAFLFAASLVPADAAGKAKTRGADLPFDINAGLNDEGRLAVAINVPVSLIDQVARDACASGGLKIIDPSAPVVSYADGDLVISNIENALGKPYIVMRPFSSGRNTIGFAVKTLTVNGSFLWTVAQWMGVTEEQAFDKVMGTLEKEFTKGMEAALASEVPTAQQLLWISHDTPSKTVYMSLANNFALPAMPKMEFDSVALEDGVISLAMSSTENAGEMSSKGYVLALDGRSFNSFLSKALNKNDSDGYAVYHHSWAEPGVPAPKQLRIAGLIQLDYRVPFRDNKPLELGYEADVYVYVPEPDNICLEIRRVKVTWWGTQYESFMFNPFSLGESIGYFQQKMIATAIDNIVANPTLAEVGEVSKLNDSTVGIKLHRGAVLPVLSRYVSITGLHFENGKVYLHYGMDFSRRRRR